MSDLLDREEILLKWDQWRRWIAEGDTSSLPRDQFEMLLDFYDDHIAELEQQNAERVKAHNEIFDALQKSERENERLRGALADIGYSDDMTLEVAVRKARRVYRKNSDE